MNKLSIKQDFSETPGPRYIFEGEYSGELFLKTVLLSRVNEAIKTKNKLLIDLDGTAGYGTSFLEESFGGLIRLHKVNLNNFKKFIELKSDEETYLITDIKEYMGKI